MGVAYRLYCPCYLLPGVQEIQQTIAEEMDDNPTGASYLAVAATPPEPGSPGEPRGAAQTEFATAAASIPPKKGQ